MIFTRKQLFHLAKELQAVDINCIDEDRRIYITKVRSVGISYGKNGVSALLFFAKYFSPETSTSDSIYIIISSRSSDLLRFIW